MATAVSQHFGVTEKGATAALACGGILAGCGAGLVDTNNEADGVKLWVHAPNLLDFDRFEIRSQR